MGYDEIRSMSGQYASYWNAFLLTVQFQVVFSDQGWGGAAWDTTRYGQ